MEIAALFTLVGDCLLMVVIPFKGTPCARKKICNKDDKIRMNSGYVVFSHLTAMEIQILERFVQVCWTVGANGRKGY